MTKTPKEIYQLAMEHAARSALLGYGVDAPGYKDCVAEARKCGESFLRDFLASVMREIDEANMEELLGIYVESDPLRKVLELAAMEEK